MSKEINKLAYFSELLTDKKDFSYDDWFYKIAETLMNHLCLEVGKTRYRITECEIYYNDGKNHIDPYIHGEEEQLTLGNLYFNRAGGLDITFGNSNIEPKIKGGILLRGLNKIATTEYINQITKITSEVFRGLGNIIKEEKSIALKEFPIQNKIVEKPTITTRVGLEKKENDKEGYISKNYRFIIDSLNPENEYALKSKILRKLFWDGKITEAEILKNINYIPRTQ